MWTILDLLSTSVDFFILPSGELFQLSITKEAVYGNQNTTIQKLKLYFIKKSSSCFPGSITHKNRER